MAFQGRLATVGYVDGVLNAQIDLEAMHSKRLKLYGVSNKLRSLEQRAEAVPEFRKQILPMMDKGKCLPWIYEVLAFERLIEAKAIMDSNQHVGKIVLEGFK
jgi:NADPH:quinone reductase-like Zn-dependent oxidoreductase